MMMEPPIEELVARVEGSKYELVTMASKRARDINAYYNQLGGEGLGRYIPPQVISQGKPLSIAFEEIFEDKIVPVHEADLPVDEPPAGD